MLLMFYGCADDSKDSSNINNSSITSESDNSSSSGGDEIINPDDNSGNSGNNDEVTNPDENEGNTGIEVTNPDENEGNTGSEVTNPDENEGNSGSEVTNPDENEGNTDSGVTNPDENTGSTGSSDDISSLPNIPPLEAETQRYIILNANGGTGGYDGYAYKIMDINNKTNIPLNTFTNNGYEFLGWSENKDAVDPKYLDGDLYEVTGNVILYAVWGKSEEVVIVTIDFTDAKNIGMPNKISFRKGSSAVLPELAAFKGGLIPVGYTKTLNSMQADYLPGDIFSDEADTTLYIAFSDGRCLDCKGQTIWVKGVNVDENSWVNKYGYAGQTVRWEANKSNWFDIYQFQYNMCWAATASNLLLWWHSQNKKYIDAYNPELNSKFEYHYDSRGRFAFSYLFDNEFRQYWENVGGQQNAGLIWFLVGQNDRGGGGYFKDVFKGKVMTKTIDNLNKVTFNYYMTDALKHNKGISFGILNPGSHAITGWGAKYDEEGFIEEIYTSNSQTESDIADIDGGGPGGLDRDKVYYKNNNVDYPTLNGNTVPLMSLYTFSLGQEYWEEYFKERGITIE